MSLPVLKTPTYELFIPSTKKLIKYRPFLVKEEKILLLVKESKDSNEILRAMKDVIHACTFEKIDPNTLALFDIEYIFLQLRGKSIGEQIELQMQCLRTIPGSSGQLSGEEVPDRQCGGEIPFAIDISEVNVHFDEKHSKVIMLDEEDGIGITLNYPNINTVVDLDNGVDEVRTVATLIENIFDRENVSDAKDSTIDKLTDFLENLTKKQYKEIREHFFDCMPELEHTVDYKCPSCGATGDYTFRGITDFF